MAARQEGKILQRIKLSLEQGDFYEAHQRYRTLYFRLVSQNRIEDALSLLNDGAIELFDKQQVDSGTDLALLYLSVLLDHKVPLTNEKIEQLCRLHSFIRGDHPDRVNFVNGAVKWTIEACKRSRTRPSGDASDAFRNIDSRFAVKYGHPDIHRGFAINLWKEKNYPESRAHFLMSYDGKSCAEMLVEFQRCVGFPTEVDLFIAQAVFHFLCMKHISVAKEALVSYTSRHPDITTSTPPFCYPLLNFLYYLLLTLEQKKLTVFTVLCEQYAIALKRDPVFFRHLDKIGQLFFGLPPAEGSARSQQPGGFLGGLMNTIFSSMTDQADDDDDFESGEEEEDDDGELYEVASDSLPAQLHRPAAADRHADVD